MLDGGFSLETSELVSVVDACSEVVASCVLPVVASGEPVVLIDGS